MHDIDEALRNLHEESGISFKKLKDANHSAGICLRNGKAYGRGLPNYLRTNRQMIVGREQAGCGGSFRDDVDHYSDSLNSFELENGSSVSDGTNPELMAFLGNVEMELPDASSTKQVVRSRAPVRNSE